MKSDNIEEFLKKYKKEKPMFATWGKYVQEYIYNELGKSSEDISKIIKIKCEPRINMKKLLIK